MHLRYRQEASGLGGNAGFTLDDLPSFHRPSDSHNHHIPPLPAENLVVSNHVHSLVDLTSDNSDDDEVQDTDTSSSGDQDRVHSVLDLTYDGIIEDPFPRLPVPPSSPLEEQPKEGTLKLPGARCATASRILNLPPFSPILGRAQHSLQQGATLENSCHAIDAQNQFDPPKPPPSEDTSPLPSFGNLQDYTPIVNRHIATFVSLPPSLRVSYFAKLKKEPKFVQLPDHVRQFIYFKLLEMVEPQLDAAQAPLPSFENPEDYTANVNSLIDTLVSLPPSLRVSYFAKVKKEPNFVQLPNHVRLFIYSKLMEMVESPQPGAAQVPVKYPTQMDLSEPSQSSPSLENPTTEKEGQKQNWNGCETSHAQLPTDSKLSMKMAESQFEQVPLKKRTQNDLPKLPHAPSVQQKDSNKPMEMIEFQSEPTQAPVRSPAQMDISEPEESSSMQQKDTKHAPTEKEGRQKPDLLGHHVRLPKDFKPGKYTVILGYRKYRCKPVGNLHLQEVCRTFLELYVQSLKGAKTEIINDILQMIREVCPVGAFVRFVEHRYWAVPDLAARAKVTSEMRELLPHFWRSTVYSKHEGYKKRQMEKLKKEGKALETEEGTEKGLIQGRSNKECWEAK
jgi:hypothetical protein